MNKSCTHNCHSKINLKKLNHPDDSVIVIKSLCRFALLKMSSSLYCKESLCSVTAEVIAGHTGTQTQMTYSVLFMAFREVLLLIRPINDIYVVRDALPFKGPKGKKKKKRIFLPLFSSVLCSIDACLFQTHRESTQ